MISTNKISIIIPYYNNDKTIEETLSSVKNQSYKNTEIIIVNDGSQEISASFLEKICSDLGIIVLNQNNSGPSVARNLGAKTATGDYLLFLDADDLIAETYLEKCISKYNQNKHLEIVYSQAKYFDFVNKKWELPELKFPDFLLNNCIHISCLIKRETFINIGLFDTNIAFTEDWELWIRIIKHYGLESVYRIPETLFFYRKRKEQNSLTDTRDIDDNAEKCRLYVYTKHYDLYKKYNLDLITLITSVDDNFKYKRKYYNIWYKKLFYKLNKKKK